MKKTVMRAVTFVFAVASVNALAVDAITVSNVRMTQDVATRTVTVTYDLANKNDEAAYVKLDILTNGVSIGMDKIKTVSGDITFVSNTVSVGTGKTIIWHPKTDWYGNVSTQAEACVRAYYKENMNCLPGIYMKIDISGGTAAQSFPVTYTFDAPSVSGYYAGAKRSQIWLKRIESCPGGFTANGPRLEGKIEGTDQYLYTNTTYNVAITRPYFIGVTPISREQFYLVTGKGASGAQSEALLANGWTDEQYNYVSYDKLRGTTNAAGVACRWPENELVDEQSFFGILRAKTGLMFDLPTKYQWEYACRAGTETSWYNGHDITNKTSDANLISIAYACGSRYGTGFDLGQTSGQHAPNAWGLYDMFGNVCELALDGPGLASGRDIDIRGSYSTTHPIMGGWWKSPASDCRITHRVSVSSSFTGNNEDKAIGFRICCPY